MSLMRVEAAVIFGIVIPQIFSISMPPAPSECLASVETFMPKICKTDEAFNSSIYGGEGCQMKGSEVCNMTIQTALDQFPSLQGCACAWAEKLCESIRALATQCHRKPEAQQRKDWQASRLIGQAHTGAGSCTERLVVCVSDAVCNRYLAPVLRACVAEPCDRDRCQRVTQQLYSSVTHRMAEMLAMCECEASDESCVQMKNTLHGGTCGDESRICQDTVYQCAEDSTCRRVLKTFQTKCWSPEEAQCSNSDLRENECLTQMDPSLILGADSECKMAFVATLGTALHSPCSCNRVHNDDLLACTNIYEVLHNRSHFMTSWKSSSGPSKPPDTNESEEGHRWSHYYLLYAFATVLLVGVVVLMPLAVVSKIWIRRRENTEFHNPHKGSCVVIL